MKNITISIANNTNGALEFISKELGISKQYIVREALNEKNLEKLFEQLKNKVHEDENKEYSFVKNNNIKSNNKELDLDLFNKVFEMWVQKREITFKKLLLQYCKEEELIIYENEWNKKTNNSPMNKSFNKLEKDLKKKDFIFNEKTMSFSNQIPGQMCIEEFIQTPNNDNKSNKNNDHESNNKIDELDELDELDDEFDELDESFDDDDDDYIHEGPAKDIY